MEGATTIWRCVIRKYRMMKKHQKPGESYRVGISCYKCSEGCVHLEYANLLLTFTPEQFLVLAEVIDKTRRQLEAELEPTDRVAPLVM